MKLLKIIYSLSLTNRFFGVLLANSLLFLAGYFENAFLQFAWLLLTAMMFVALADLIMLLVPGYAVTASRVIPEKMSNGDENPVRIMVAHRYPYRMHTEIVEEPPAELQIRNLRFKDRLQPGRKTTYSYTIRPVRRGEHTFGRTRVFAFSFFGFWERRYVFDNSVTLPVYPAFLQMRRFRFMALANRLNEAGVRRIRHIGNLTEFEKIREYVSGDDLKTINWKATARKNRLMVNQYVEEKAQHIWSVIDMGRVMQPAFDDLTLLDYSINSSLVLSCIALMKQDRAGLMTFDNQIRCLLPADNKNTQLQEIMELLYRQETTFAEPDYALMSATLLSRINRRSLIILYTNIESLPSLHRNLPALTRLAGKHLVMTVFFENTTIRQTLTGISKKIPDAYERGLAEKYLFDKIQIQKELTRAGIIPLLTTPAALSVNLINKYLEIKARKIL